jgi:hypothetical protein
MTILTFSSCFYIIKSKFDASTYVYWMNNFISIVNHFNLVIYTDENSFKYIDTKGNPRIKVVIKPLDQFHHYQYKDYWIQNHEKNVYLNDRIDWSVNMLWSEKIWFVKETFEKKYFETDFYGWCDIGYFRNRANLDIHTFYLDCWASSEKCRNLLDPSKIHYACINNNQHYMEQMTQLINNKNEKGLPTNPIPPIQQSIAGGFFILHRNKIKWWAKIYETKLRDYFENDYLVKDDQMILVNCILDDDLKHHFQLYYEKKPKLDNWFLFQRIL